PAIDQRGVRERWSDHAAICGKGVLALLDRPRGETARDLRLLEGAQRALIRAQDVRHEPRSGPVQRRNFLEFEYVGEHVAGLGEYQSNRLEAVLDRHEARHHALALVAD